MYLKCKIERRTEKKPKSFVNLEDISGLTFLVFFSIWPSEVLPRPPAALPADDGNEPVAIFENGTGSENLMVCKSCMTTLETLRNDNLRLDPMAERTPKVFNIKGCGKKNILRFIFKSIYKPYAWIIIGVK